MAVAAPRIDLRLVRFLERASESSAGPAEICRAVGEAAGELGLPRPSYEQVRTRLRRYRSVRRRPGLGEVALEVAFRSRPPEAFFDEAIEAFLRAQYRAAEPK